MAKMLCYDLNLTDKTYLGNMALHPGFTVLKKLMEDACLKATAEVIKLDPLVDNYERKLASLQNTARATNDFCASVIRSVETHMAGAVHETNEIETAETILADKQ